MALGADPDSWRSGGLQWERGTLKLIADVAIDCDASATDHPHPCWSGGLPRVGGNPKPIVDADIDSDAGVDLSRSRWLTFEFSCNGQSHLLHPPRRPAAMGLGRLNAGLGLDLGGRGGTS